MSSLKETVGNLVLLISSFHKDDPNRLQLGTCDEHVWARALQRQTLKETGAKQEDPNKACSTTACRQTKEQKQLDQARLQESQLRQDLSQQLHKKQEDKKQTIGNNTNSLGTACNNSLGNNNLGIEEQQGHRESLEQQPLAFRRSSLQLWKIFFDTGAELSVAPRDFAAETQLSPLHQDLELRTANGEAIEIFGLRTVQLFSQGFSFTMNFVIADVQQPLLGLGSLLNANLSLQLDKTLGHHLGNKAGEKIHLEQRGLQLYLSACPAQLELTPCMIGNLLTDSLVPEAKSLGPKVDMQLDKRVLNQGGAVGSSLPLGTLRQHKQHRTKTAIGQQALPKAKPKQKPKGQAKASKLRTSEKNNFMEKMLLALLEPEDPRGSLDQNTAKDLSLRIFLTLSLMKKWRLKTVRLQTALPQQLTSTQLRELGLRETEVDSQIFVGDQLGVFQHGETWLIGGEQVQQEAFLHKLSASFTLTDTQQLEQNTPLSFMGKTLEFNQAERTISLYLPTAFYSDLMSRYSLEEAATRSTPTEQLDQRAPRWQNIILDATRTKLYKQTVGDLIWSSMLRPDTSFAVHQLSKSFMHPTEQDEEQLRSLLRYMKGTQQYSVSLGPPRKWKKAKNFELLAFSTSWSEACRSTMGVSLSLMGVPCAASIQTQATTKAAAELSSVKLACTLAFHTKSLLQDFQLEQPLSFRVLTRGPVAQKLGLSKKSRRIELWSRLGQFQLSKAQPQQNLAEQLTNTHTASGLHRLLPKLRMHTRLAEMLALPTELAGETAFFESSSRNFYIGSLSKAPAMAQLCYVLKSFWGKSLKSTTTSQSLTQLYCQRTACSKMSFWRLIRQRAFNNRAYSQMSLRQLTLEIAFSIRAYMQMSLWQLTLQRAFSLSAYNRKSFLGSKPSSQPARQELHRISLML